MRLLRDALITIVGLAAGHGRPDDASEHHDSHDHPNRICLRVDLNRYVTKEGAVT